MEVSPGQATQVKDIGIMEPQTISDPWKLMDAFYSSDIYKQRREMFLSKKVFAADVTEKEKDKAFLESEGAEYALDKFGTQNVVFRYQETKYPVQVGGSIEKYADFVRKSQKLETRGLDQGQLEVFDSEKFLLHSEAAAALVKAGIAPSRNIGRVIVELILLDKGLGSPFAMETTAAKMRRKLGFAS